MVPSRRQVLLSALAGFTGVAGCSEPPTPDGVDRPVRGDSGSDRDPVVHQPRNLEGGPIIVERGTDGPGRIHRELINDPDRLAEIEFAPGVPESDVESTRTFLEATDFDEETIYVSLMGVESCDRYRIHSVTWDVPGRRIEYEYCEELRPPDADCRADTRETVGLFFRLPTVLEMDLRGSGSSGHAPCRNADTEYAVIDTNASTEGR